MVKWSPMAAWLSHWLIGAALAGMTCLGVAAAAEVTGDPDHGKTIYARCAACHSLTTDRTGPRHCGLLGRRAGTVAGFGYSGPMKNSGIVWTAATLDSFLADPMKSVPGTAMGYAGVSDAQERADLVAYLVRASTSGECRS